MICFCGKLAIGKAADDGQIVKTRIIYDEILMRYPDCQVETVDTSKIRICPIKEMYRLAKLFISANRIVILPAQGAIRVLLPLVWLLRKEKNTYYIVIGGWLPEVLASNAFLRKIAKRLRGIYVETIGIKDKLAELTVNNSFYLPNCKPIKRVIVSSGCKFHFCYFARVSEEKGVNMAIEAIQTVKQRLCNENVKLDIYGRIDENYYDTFQKKIAQFPPYIKYCGIADSSDTAVVLKNYYALLFPTHYCGEGFPGTIIDAFAAGLPVIASNWKYNTEIVNNLENGIIFNYSSIDEFISAIIYAINNPKEMEKMRKNCVKEAIKYTPEKALKEFFCHIGETEND